MTAAPDRPAAATPSLPHAGAGEAHSLGRVWQPRRSACGERDPTSWPQPRPLRRGRGGRFRPIKSTSKRGGEKITPQRPLFVAAHYTALRSIPLSVRADDFIFAEFCNRSSVMGCKWLRGETHARDRGSARPDDFAAISCNRRGSLPRVSNKRKPHYLTSPAVP